MELCYFLLELSSSFIVAHLSNVADQTNGTNYTTETSEESSFFCMNCFHFLQEVPLSNTHHVGNVLGRARLYMTIKTLLLVNNKRMAAAP
jgi:hypothetical protein